MIPLRIMKYLTELGVSWQESTCRGDRAGGSWVQKLQWASPHRDTNLTAVYALSRLHKRQGSQVRDHSARFSIIMRAVLKEAGKGVATSRLSAPSSTAWRDISHSVEVEGVKNPDFRLETQY